MEKVPFSGDEVKLLKLFPRLLWRVFPHCFLSRWRVNPIKIELFSVFNLSVLSPPVLVGERKTIMRRDQRT